MNEIISLENGSDFFKGFDPSPLLNYATAIQVIDELTAKQALSCGLQARKFKAQVEETRKNIVRPHIDFQKEAMRFAKELNEKFEEIEFSLQGKVETWLKAEKENMFSGIDSLAVEDGSISLKTSWTFVIEDETAIPREYMTVDQTAIKKAVDNGVRNIPGVKIGNYQSSQMRVKN